MECVQTRGLEEEFQFRYLILSAKVHKKVNENIRTISKDTLYLGKMD